MPHRLADNEETGEKAMLSVGETPWHEEGVEIERGSSAQYDLRTAMNLAGIDFRVTTSKNFTEIDGDTIETDSYSIVRTDTYDILGTVSDRYAPLQNVDAFSSLKPALEGGLASIETAGAVKDGKTVWMLVKFQRDEILRKIREQEQNPSNIEEMFEELLPYSLFLNHHTGNGSAKVQTTPIRVVCNNTLQASLKGESTFSLNIRHIGEVEAKYEDATDKLFTNVISTLSTFSSYRKLLKDNTIPPEVFTEDVCEEISPTEHLKEKVESGSATSRTETALQKAKERQTEVWNCWINGTGNSGNKSGWEAYNGAVEFLDHHDKAVSGEKRVAKMISGSVKNKKEKVSENILDYCMLSSREQSEYLESIKN